MTIKAVFRNNSGAITVDGTYKNLQFHSKSSVNEGTAQLLPLVSSSPNLWAIRSENGIMMCPAWGTAMGVGSTDRWSVVGSGERYEFCRKDFIRANPGINMYSPSGELVFSSNIKPMRIVDAVSGSINMNGGTVILERYYRSSRKYAVVMGSIPVRIAAWDNAMRTFCPLIQTVDNYVKVSIAQMTTSTAGRYRGDLTTSIYNFLVVDVTGY